MRNSDAVNSGSGAAEQDGGRPEKLSPKDISACHFARLVVVFALITLLPKQLCAGGNVGVPDPAPTVKTDEVDRYVTFAKAYGYIRYFYPGDRAAGVDWDKFAYYGVAHLSDSSSRNFRDDLTSLFLQIAPDIRIHGTNEKSGTFATSTESPQNLKPVYWQHLGDGDGSIGYPYKSMRVNRPANVLPQSTNDFGAISMNLPVEEILGKELRLTGRILANSVYTGTPSLIILVKEKGKDAKRLSSQGQPVSADGWLPHSTTAKIPDSVERITIYAQSITLAGSVRFDDLSWAVKNGQEWQVQELVNFNTMNEAAFNQAWKTFAPTQDIKLSGNKNEKWVDFSRAKGEVKEVDPLFPVTLEKSEWLTKPIGRGLSLTFPLVIHAPAVNDRFSLGGKGDNPLAARLEAIPATSLKAENVNCRLANIIILWNKLQHFHPDNPMTTSQWGIQLKKAITQTLRDETLEGHRKTLTQMIAPINDSHMTLYYSSIVMEEFYLPLQWERIEKEIVITRVFDDTLPISPGDIVTHVNGITAETYWKQASSSVIGATESRKQSKIMDESLKGRKGSVVHVKLAGHEQQIKLERELSEFEFSRHLKQTKGLSQYSQIEPGIYYVDLTEISWEDLQSHLPELAGAKAVIFDVRGYPSWETHQIVSYFIREPVSQMKYGVPRISFPDRAEMEFSYAAGEILKPRQPYIGARKIFLTDGRAISYSEDFLNLVSYYELAEIVGQPTAGTTGNVNMAYLFGGLSTPWTGMRVLRQDGIPFNGTGVAPDYYVEKSIKGVAEGRDEYIEYVLKSLLEL